MTPPIAFPWQATFRLAAGLLALSLSLPQPDAAGLRLTGTAPTAAGIHVAKTVR